RSGLPRKRPRPERQIKNTPRSAQSRHNREIASGTKFSIHAFWSELARRVYEYSAIESSRMSSVSRGFIHVATNYSRAPGDNCKRAAARVVCVRACSSADQSEYGSAAGRIGSLAGAAGSDRLRPTECRDEHAHAAECESSQ